MPRERAVIFGTHCSRYLGVVTDPVASATNGLCLLLPGSGPLDVDGQVGPNRFLLDLANQLGARGLRTARFGKRPISTSRASISDYVEEYVEPVMALTEHLQAIGVSTQPLILIGHSLGGHVAPLVASNLPVSGIALLNAPFEDLQTIMRQQLERSGQGTDPPLAYADALDPSLVAYLAHAGAFDPRSCLASQRYRFFMASCGRDAQVPTRQASLWFQHLSPNHEVESYDYQTLNHLFAPAENHNLNNVAHAAGVDSRFLDDLASWCHKCLTASIPFP